LEHHNIRKHLWQHSFSLISLGKILRLILGGFPAFNRQGGSFYNPEGPVFFRKTLKKYLQPGIPLHVLPHPINDPEFSEAVLESLEQVIKMGAKPN
jgi:uncharacterized protein (UPF0261 family)